MIAFPNAKINLGLKVVEKRPDEFHNIETVFCPIPLFDILEILPADPGTPVFSVSGIPIPGPESSNLCRRAQTLFYASLPNPHATLPSIYLHKMIPMGSGLGGGSSNGAFTLRLLNSFWDQPLKDDILIELAQQLGSDCPFFLWNIPAFASGRGEVLREVSLNLKGFTLGLVIPPVHVSTSEAYSLVKPGPSSEPLIPIVGLPVAEWKGRLVNDFEEPIFKRFPAIGEVKERLYQLGAAYASMSGSGSAVYGLFPETVQLDGYFPEGYFIFTCKF